ncbi:LysR substrate-binding domain-containing protein [Endozoicomonas euniceicola]|uniref:LysR substrate-binding domain-containing protein n=1 Tax=Endozoicomonas euniceicola TaxID=1234143 RepID=A0ABY6H1Q3_9GAMM|nr:LysR substrate-binding domain-containing protein [Endozoicomonas euniceicola]UYM18196.1 LysR substrate-binding domain-containing protein [Endozoicomonas euniceicola]
MIPTDSLEIVRAVAHFRNFTAAAKHLHKVPSAISYTVRKLEERLDVQLFLRDSKRVELTPAGEHFIKHTDRLLLELEELELSTRQMATGWEQELRIALDNVVNQGMVYDLVRDFQAVRPETNLIINTEVHNGSWDALFHNRCQLVLGAPKIIPDNILNNDRFEWKTMGSLSWDFVVSPDHPLAKVSEPLTQDIIREHTSICIQDTSRVFQHGYNLLLDDQQVLTVPSFRMAIECLVKGLGSTILPSHFAKPYIDAGQLIRCEVVDIPMSDGCFLAWNRENMGNGLRWVLEWLGEEDWLNKIWLQHDNNKPVGYHVP